MRSASFLWVPYLNSCQSVFQCIGGRESLGIPHTTSHLSLSTTRYIIVPTYLPTYHTDLACYLSSRYATGQTLLLLSFASLCLSFSPSCLPSSLGTGSSKLHFPRQFPSTHRPHRTYPTVPYLKWHRLRCSLFACIAESAPSITTASTQYFSPHTLINTARERVALHSRSRHYPIPLLRSAPLALATRQLGTYEPTLASASTLSSPAPVVASIRSPLAILDKASVQAGRRNKTQGGHMRS